MRVSKPIHSPMLIRSPLKPSSMSMLAPARRAMRIFQAGCLAALAAGAAWAIEPAPPAKPAASTSSERSTKAAKEDTRENCREETGRFEARRNIFRAAAGRPKKCKPHGQACVGAKAATTPRATAKTGQKPAAKLPGTRRVTRPSTGSDSTQTTLAAKAFAAPASLQWRRGRFKRTELWARPQHRSNLAWWHTRRYSGTSRTQPTYRWKMRRR